MDGHGNSLVEAFAPTPTPLGSPVRSDGRFLRPRTSGFPEPDDTYLKRRFECTEDRMVSTPSGEALVAVLGTQEFGVVAQQEDSVTVAE